MASPDTGGAPAKGDETASPWPLRKLQGFTPGLWSQYKAYEDAFVERAKGTVSDALVLASEHPTEAIGCAAVAGLILLRGERRQRAAGIRGVGVGSGRRPANNGSGQHGLRHVARPGHFRHAAWRKPAVSAVSHGGSHVTWQKPAFRRAAWRKPSGVAKAKRPRRFLYRHTLGRFKTEKDLLNDVEQSMLEYKTSIETLKKDSKYTLNKIAIGESDLQRGQTDLRASGKQIQSLISSIYKAESTATGLMDRLRTIPTRQSLELRAEVASMAYDLKNQRYVLEERINKISEYGVHV